MIIKHFKSLLFAVIGVFYALTATAAISVFSEYGLIQNVQNYSTNPFWSPNAPYNQRLPQPVYVQGADLNADDCINVVQSLVSVQCMARDNCKNAELSDVRPAIMVQLSNLPGANYVSSCSGYIDGIFESYKRQYANTLPNRPTAFPDATVPNPDLNNDDGSIKFENPYKRQTPKWQQEQNERAAELQALQRQNGVGGEHVQYTDFPATYADLSFSERIENDRAGLEPFKDLKAYKTLDVKTAEEWCGKDGEHANSPECVAWRDCTDTIKPNDSRIVHAEYDSSHKNCLVTKCEEGFSPNKQKTGCIDAAGKDCTSQYEEVPNVKYAEIDSNGDCIVLYCDEGYKVHLNKKECEEDTAQSNIRGGEEQEAEQENIEQENTAGYYYARIRISRAASKNEIPKDCDYSTCFFTCKTAFCGSYGLDRLNKIASQKLTWWPHKENHPDNRNYCASPEHGGMLVESDTATILQMTEVQKNEFLSLVEKEIANKGGCYGIIGAKIYLEIGQIPQGGNYTDFRIIKKVFLND